MTAAVLGLGGNVGDVRSTLRRAVRLLADRPGLTVIAASPLYRTPPWGKTDQPPFRNAALRVETDLAAPDLLAAALATEAALGRHRDEKWGPRTVDIDILLFGEGETQLPGLEIPHPRLGERAFALRPLVDLWPHARLGGKDAAAWLAACDVTGLERVEGPGWAGLSARIEPDQPTR